MNRRLGFFIFLWTIATSLSFFLLYKMERVDDIRAGISENYMKPFSWIDIPVFILIILVVYSLCYCLAMKRNFFRKKMITNKPVTVKKERDQCRFPVVWGTILLVWTIFFLVFFPGTAMNDTIYILKNPWELSAQHPILYNLYTYGLFSLGKQLSGPNMGLALISVLQMLLLSLLLSSIIVYLFKKGVSGKLCMVLTLYFSCAPIFPIYAVSAIKDTPFTMALLALMFLMYRLSERDFADNRIRMMFLLFGCFFFISCFRSNGKYIVLLTAVMLAVVYGKKWLSVLLSGTAAIIMTAVLSTVLIPKDVSPLFQESVGIQIQQLGAVIAYDGEIEQADREYLYALLPEEEWKEYAPCCADILKWDDSFDRQYLNQTKGQFLSVWLRTFPKNVKIYVNAYLMNTCGFWGIETRSSEQYYVKDIFENDLGLYQKSPLPGVVRTLIYKWYCNRFTLTYLSAGTGIWLLFSVSLYLWYKKEWKRLVVFVPVWGIWLSLMLATPIAFCFRYVFILQFILPVAGILLYQRWKKEIGIVSESVE